MIYSIKNSKKKFETVESIDKIISQIEEDHTCFILSGNTFHFDPFKKLMGHLSKNKIKTLVLSRSFATLPYEELLNCLECISKIDPTHLEELDLSDNAISAIIPPFFYDFLVKCEKLKKFYARNCGFGALGSKNLSDAIKSIKNKENLHTVDISKNKLDYGAHHMCKALSEFKNLKILEIQYNSIPRNTMKKCIEYLENINLIQLNLTDNLISRNGCFILGKMSKKMKSLKLGDCLIGDLGLLSFVDGYLDVNQNEKLNDVRTEVDKAKIEQEKNLEVDSEESESDIEDEEKMQIIKKFNESLNSFNPESNSEQSSKDSLYLNISYNDITEDGLSILSLAIAKMNVYKLDISGNDIDPDNCPDYKQFDVKLIVNDDDDEEEHVLEQFARVL